MASAEELLLSDDDGMDWDWDDSTFLEQSYLIGEWTYLADLQNVIEEDGL
jgi:hypothetical protein